MAQTLYGSMKLPLNRSQVTVIIYLYREYAIYNLLFTGLGIYLLFRYGGLSTPFIFWLKVMGYVVTALIYYWSRRKHLYFFHNLGWTLKELAGAALVIDAILTVLILVITAFFVR